MLDFCIKNSYNPLEDIKVDLGVDQPLWKYVQKAIQDMEIINVLALNPIEGLKEIPFLHICNWHWDPHPQASEVQYRRRETGDKLSTKFTSDTRIGILSWDTYIGARDKNNKIETEVVHNKIYIPLEDDKGRYLINSLWYPQYQLVDKLLYPSGKGKKSITLKSLLPIVIDFIPTQETSLSGTIIDAEIGQVKIFNNMEPILSCFMHIQSPLCYLGVFPILQFCDHISKDEDQYDYFQPIPDTKIYIKAYKEGVKKFEYVRTILVMAISLIRKYQPKDVKELNSPEWWVYQLSDHDDVIAHRGACHEMHVARMLDTISAQVLPIPVVDKRTMTALLRYVLQTEFDDVDIYSYENKRLRRNEIVSTIVTAEISDKLKRIFKFGVLLKMKDLRPLLNFRPGEIWGLNFELPGTLRTRVCRPIY